MADNEVKTNMPSYTEIGKSMELLWESWEARILEDPLTGSITVYPTAEEREKAEK